MNIELYVVYFDQLIILTGCLGELSRPPLRGVVIVGNVSTQTHSSRKLSWSIFHRILAGDDSSIRVCLISKKIRHQYDVAIFGWISLEAL